MKEFAHIPSGLGASVLIVLIVGGALVFLGRRRPDPITWGAGLGLGMAWIVGHAFVTERLQTGWWENLRSAFRDWDGSVDQFPLFPLDVVHWLPWIVALTTLLACLDGVWPAPMWARWQNRLLITGLMLGLILFPLTSQTWERRETIAWMLSLGGGILIVWQSLDRRARVLGDAMPTILGLLAASLAICLGLSGSSVYGALAGVLATGCLGLWCISWVDRRMILNRSVVPIFTIVYTGLIVCGLSYSELSRGAAIGLAGAPLVTFVDRFGIVSRMSPRKTAMVRLAVLMIPLIATIVYSAMLRPPEAPSDGYGRRHSDANPAIAVAWSR